MSEILNSTIDTIKSLPATLRAILLIILIGVAGFLAYTQMSAPAEEAGKVINGGVSQEATQTGENNNANSTISF